MTLIPFESDLITKKQILHQRVSAFCDWISCMLAVLEYRAGMTWLRTIEITS